MLFCLFLAEYIGIKPRKREHSLAFNNHYLYLYVIPYSIFLSWQTMFISLYSVMRIGFLLSWSWFHSANKCHETFKREGVGGCRGPICSVFFFQMFSYWLFLEILMFFLLKIPNIVLLQTLPFPSHTPFPSHPNPLPSPSPTPFPWLIRIWFQMCPSYKKYFKCVLNPQKWINFSTSRKLDFFRQVYSHVFHVKKFLGPLSDWSKFGRNITWKTCIYSEFKIVLIFW